MSHAAYQARLHNLGHRIRPRTYAETRRIELEIALASHGHESYREMARRLGLRSHAYCWRVVHRYRTGQIQSLPLDEEALVAMRRSLGLGEIVADTALASPARANMGGICEVSGHEPRVMTTDERIAETWHEVAEWKRKNPPRYDTRRRISVPIPR